MLCKATNSRFHGLVGFCKNGLPGEKMLDESSANVSACRRLLKWPSFVAIGLIWDEVAMIKVGKDSSVDKLRAC